MTGKDGIMKKRESATREYNSKPRFRNSTIVAIAFTTISGCSTMRISKPADRDQNVSPGAFQRAENLFKLGRHEAAVQENQRLLAEKHAPADVALFNIGLISAHSSNPKRDYPLALNSFGTLIRLYPSSPLAEVSRLWITTIEEHQRSADERQKLMEEKRTLARERENLSQERERLKYVAEKTRQIDLEIEKRRRETLRK
jgi:hypothetical protein